jgi:PadR family transcriptional regulator PadR
MYPILARMLDEGWLIDGWEDQVQVGRAKRPPRRYYRLTDKGKAELGAVIAEARRDTRFGQLIARPAVGGLV